APGTSARRTYTSPKQRGPTVRLAHAPLMSTDRIRPIWQGRKEILQRRGGEVKGQAKFFWVNRARRLGDGSLPSSGGARESDKGTRKKAGNGLTERRLSPPATAFRPLIKSAPSHIFFIFCMTGFCAPRYNPFL